MGAGELQIFFRLLCRNFGLHNNAKRNERNAIIKSASACRL
jgi:hypothetical protein